MEQMEQSTASTTSSGFGITGLLIWLAEIRKQILNRKQFFLFGGLMALALGIFTYMNFDPTIRPIAAVLRSQFWLFLHVSWIAVAYAFAMVGCILAVMSLRIYSFGRYRLEKDAKNGTVIMRPPQLCLQMAPYILIFIQTGMLFLTIGTILGGRWADYSWGRFWGWDAKEVWALITILVCLITLHAYKARFFREIGLACGAILGAVAVYLTAYLFNFMLRASRHAYSGVDGGQATGIFIITAAVCGVLLLWMIDALIRYHMEMRKTKEP